MGGQLGRSAAAGVQAVGAAKIAEWYKGGEGVMGMRKANGKSIGGHQSPTRLSDDWITPRWLTEAMGPFDLDPCECQPQPWILANRSYSIYRGENGLHLPWEGSVFVNPPYSDPQPWARRLAEHGDGVFLTFARVETAWWQDWVWPHSSAIWFPRGRLTFCKPDGEPAKHNSGGPSALIAYGDRCDLLLEQLHVKFGGALVTNIITPISDVFLDSSLFDTQGYGLGDCHDEGTLP